MNTVISLDQAFTRLTELENERQTLLDNVRSNKGEFRKHFASLMSGVFTDHPDIFAIVWAQYTPHFNDGDVCEFSVCDIMGFSEQNIREYNELEDGEEIDHDSITSLYGEMWADGEYFCESDFEKYGLKHIFKNEDLMQTIFGDDKLVLLVRGEDKFHISYYEHY